MSIINFPAPICSSAAVIGAAVAALVALSPMSDADDQNGLRVRRQTPTQARGTQSCLGTPYPDQASVESRALAMCNYLKNRGCTVVVSYTDCGAIAGNGSQRAAAGAPRK